MLANGAIQFITKMCSFNLVSGCQSEGARYRDQRTMASIAQKALPNVTLTVSAINTLTGSLASAKTPSLPAPGESKSETKRTVRDCREANRQRDYKKYPPEKTRAKMEKMRLLAIRAQENESKEQEKERLEIKTARTQLRTTLEMAIRTVEAHKHEWQQWPQLEAVAVNLKDNVLPILNAKGFPFIPYNKVSEAIEKAFEVAEEAKGEDEFVYNIPEDVTEIKDGLDDEAELAGRGLFEKYANMNLKNEIYSTFGDEKLYDDGRYSVLMENCETRFPCGVASSSGAKETMEDAHLATEIEFKVGPNKTPVRADLRAIFDGHGGNECAEFARQHLVGHLTRTLNSCCEKSMTDTAICEALKDALPDLSEDFRVRGPKRSVAGTTVNLSLYIPALKTLFVANLGDSRGVVIDEHENVIQASVDQKPDDSRMEKEITARGGFVENNRVLGLLGTARAVGDLWDEEGVISARPDVAIFRELENFSLIQACDGLFDVCITNEAGKAAIEGLKKPHATPARVAATIVGNALEAGSLDNVTVMISRFGKGSSSSSTSSTSSSSTSPSSTTLA